MVVILLSTESDGAQRTPLPRRKEVRFVRVDAAPPQQADGAQSGVRLVGAPRSGRRLAKAAGTQARRRIGDAAKKMGGAVRKTPRRSPRPPAAEKAPGKDALGGLGKLLSPKNFDQSMDTIANLRSFCRQCVRYVQQADSVLDTLFVTGSSLKETGVLKKIAESKGKNLSTDDLTNILLSLMNSPIGATIFQKMSGSKDASDGSKGAATALPPAGDGRSPATPAAHPALPAPPVQPAARLRPAVQGPLPPMAPLGRPQPRPPGH